MRLIPERGQKNGKKSKKMEKNSKKDLGTLLAFFDKIFVFFKKIE